MVCLKGGRSRVFFPSFRQNMNEINDENRLSPLDDDSPYRQSQQLYWSDRVFLPQWNTEDVSLTEDSGTNVWPADSLRQDQDDNALFRDRRQFYRFGRAHEPTLDKRFLRFGRSWQPDSSDYHKILVLPWNRKRRSPDSQSEGLVHRNKRSERSSENGEKLMYNDSNKDAQKLESINNLKNMERFDNRKQANDELEMDKRFMRFGKRFMRFGRGFEGANKRFMRFGKRLISDEDLDKRFMRFGKRFMRFGRGKGEEENTDKRFMRFGKSIDHNNDDEKRFMRFGKRFMRFGKRFMRFGRGGSDDEDQVIWFDKDSNDNEFMQSEKLLR